MIDENKLYSLGEIVREKLIPGIDTIPKASRLVNSPITRDVLQTQAVQRGARGIQYQVKGQFIKEYLQNVKASKKAAKKRATKKVKHT